MTEMPSPESPRKSLLIWLWNPFVYIAGGPALAIGLVIILISGYLASLSNTHFDGVLDTHTGFKTPLWFFLAEGFSNWLCLSLVLLLAGFIIAKDRRFRTLDLLGTQALARGPFLITALVANLPGFTAFNAKLLAITKQGKLTLPSASAAEFAAFGFVTLTMLVVTIWFVALSWKSFRISCDTRGWKAITAFTIGIILAEILSKLVFWKVLLAIL